MSGVYVTNLVKICEGPSTDVSVFFAQSKTIAKMVEVADKKREKVVLQPSPTDRKPPWTHNSLTTATNRTWQE